MDTRGKHTLDEILSQTQAWQEALDRIERHYPELEPFGARDPGRQLFYTGCGSTYYLSLAAAAHLRTLTHWRVQAIPASELWLDPQSYFQKDDVLVAISRSGTTTETLHAAEAFRTLTHHLPITIQCTPNAPLARRGGVNIVIPSGAEQSIAQTRSFASMFVAALALNVHWARRGDLARALARLPQAGEHVLESARVFAHNWGPRLEFDRIYFLGSGTRYGLACEASLKMKEMSLSHAEPFHFLEFRHGPKSMVTETTLIVGLVSDHARAQETRILDEAARLGAKVLMLGEHVKPIRDGAAISFESRLPPEARDVLYLPPLQLLAYERATAKGLDPDRPRHLEAVVVLEG